MTRDEIIRWAKQAGWERVGRNPSTGPEYPVLITRLERFAAIVAGEQMEQTKEWIATWVESWGNDLTIKDIVEGIRTNGNGVTRPIKYVTRDSGEG